MISESVRESAKKPKASKEARKSDYSQPVNSSIDHILFLQRTIGNQAVGRLIKYGALQAKLRIGQPGDIYEQEADRVAEQVMRMPAPETTTGQRLLVHELTHVIQQGRSTNIPNHHLFRLTEEEKKENLKSRKYVGNRRLEKAFDNDPPLGIGESGEAVRRVQEGLVADGFDMPESTKPTGDLDGAFGSETFAKIRKFQAKYGLIVDGIVGRETMGKLDELDINSKSPPPYFLGPAVDRIDIIDTQSGAINCFGQIMGNSNLNNPGPFNDRSTGEVTNVHQIHFHLDRGKSSELIPERFIDAIYSYARIPQPRNGPDGPPPHEICRMSENKLVVADPPGMWMYSDWIGYPFKLNAHFYLMVSNTLGHRIAQVEYNVEIEKTNKDNIPNKINCVYPTKKRDLVRNRDL